MKARRKVLAITSELDARQGRAQGHANTDFLRLPGHRIGDHSIDSERSQNQAQGCKCGHEQHKEAARRDGMIHNLLDGAKFRRRLSRIDRAQRTMTLAASTSGGSLVRTTSSAPSGSAWVTGHIDLGARGVFHAAFANIGDYAYDPRVALPDPLSQAPQRILARPFAAGRGLIDDDDRFARGVSAS